MDTSNPNEPQIKLETLQKLSFELITKSMELWRTYRERGRGKKTKLRVAVEIHRMITDAMRVHPDIKHLKELTEFYEKVKVEYELAKKS
jgi:hypothetical protein